MTMTFILLYERRNNHEFLDFLRTYNPLVYLSNDVREAIAGRQA